MTYLFLILSVINPKLQVKLGNMDSNDVINILIQLPSADYNYAWRLKSEGYDPFKYLKEYCYSTQKEFIDFLIKNGINKDDIIQLYIANKIGVRNVPKKLIFKLENELGDKTVDIREDEIVAKIPPNETWVPLGNFFPGEDYVSPSQENIKAPHLWAKGYKGNGIVIAVMDTGADILRCPQIRHRWRKQFGWRYAANTGITTPQDTFSSSGYHGTACSGLAVGENGIGAAPNAHLIVCGIMDATESQMSATFQWLINLDSLRPHITSNSWSFTSTTVTSFWDEMQSQMLANIITVAAVGNSGPTASTVRPPASYPLVFGVGATYWDLEWVTEYSSRGPAPNQLPWTDTNWWPRSDWNRRKPDIIAPAEPTITISAGGNWQTFSGTSAATPHTAGALALILQANTFGEFQDTARLRRIYRILTDYAYLQGAITTWPNDSFGWGRIDVVKMLNNLPVPKVPHIFISNVRVKDHNNNTLSSGEVDTLYITLKNTGANATNVVAEIVYRDPSGITLTDNSSSYGTLNRFEEKENPSSDRFQVTMPTLGDTTWTYWTLRIRYQYTIDGSTRTDTIWDFFHLVSDFSSKPTYRDTLRNDDGSAAIYYTPAYCAAQFSTPSTDTIIAVKYLLYQGAGTVCSVMVWNDNNGLPLDPPVYKQAFTADSVYTNWKTVWLTTRPVMSGDYWVGVWTPQGAATYPLSDNGVSGSMAYKNQGGSWAINTSGDFMFRPYVGRSTVSKPLIRSLSYNISDREFGNDNGVIEPSERLGLYISLKNNGVNAVQCTLWLKRANSYTQTRVTPIDTISFIREINTGVDVANNYNDPWVIQFWDNDSLFGRNLSFKVIIKGIYGTGLIYNDSFGLNISEPFMPRWADTLRYDFGTSPSGWLYIGASASGTTRYWATRLYFGNARFDSFYIDSVAIRAYNDGTSSRTMYFYLWRDSTLTNFPADTICRSSLSVAAGGNSIWRLLPRVRYLPGWVWYGQNVILGTLGTGLKPILWEAPNIADYTYYNTAERNWAPGSSIFWARMPITQFIYIRHDHPTLSYYKPSGWTWPALLTNTSGTQTLPSLINGCWPGSIIYSHMAFINRSTRPINTTSPRTARGTWENHFHLDNYSRWSGTATNLDVFSSLTYTNQSIYVPGGRHTVMLYGDKTNNVMGNILNVPYRFWGKQYSLTAPNFPPDSSIKEPWVPPMTGPFAGDYPNATAYKLKFPGTSLKYYCFGVRPFRMNIASDTIDIDIEVYSDFPTSPYNGYTNFISGSGLGPGKVDFVVFNDKNYDSLAVGIYNFLDARDSAFCDFREGKKYISQWSSTRVAAVIDSFKTMRDVVKVYNLVVPTTASYACSVKSLAGTNLGIAIFPKGNIFSRSGALREDDDGGAGVVEGFANISLTAGDTLAIVIWKNDNYEAKAPVPCSLFVRRQSDGFYGGVPLATHLVELSYFATYEGVNIMFTTNNIEYVEIYRKSSDSEYELITKTKNSPFIDKDVENGKIYDYKLNFVFTDGYNEEKTFSITYYGITKLDITYDSKTNKMFLYIPKYGEYKVSIYDITGRLINQPVSGIKKHGIFPIQIELKIGIYFVVAEGNKEKKILKIPIIK